MSPHRCALLHMLVALWISTVVSVPDSGAVNETVESAPRRRSSGGPRRRRWSLEIAKEANKLFHESDFGVYIHTDHQELSAVDRQSTQYNTMSWSLLNKNSFDGDKLKIFNGGSGVPAVLAKTHASKIVACSYPCDGFVNERNYNKCHVKGCPCTAEGGKDWCGHRVHGADSRPCAFKWSETKYMMKAFADAKYGKSPLLKNGACTKRLSWNEVIMDPNKWNKDIKYYLWAFVLMDSCKGDCEKSLRRLHKSYTAKHGYVPIVRLNRHNKDRPFSSSTANEMDALTDYDEEAKAVDKENSDDESETEDEQEEAAKNKDEDEAERASEDANQSLAFDMPSSREDTGVQLADNVTAAVMV